MTGREKIEAALSKEGTSEIPVVFCYERIFIRDHWSELTGSAVWESHLPDVERQLAFSRKIIETVGQDWVRVYPFYSAEDRENLEIEFRGDDASLVDRRTGEAVRLDDVGFGRWGGAEGAPGEGYADLSLRVLDECGVSLFPFYHVLSPFWSCEGLWGFEDLMLKTVSAPDLIGHACERFLELAIEEVGKAAALGAAGIWIEECYTDMIAPEAFRGLSLPYLQALIEEIRGRGLASIYYYCGNPAGKWDLILLGGADALALEESKKNFTIDIEDVVERVGGRCAVLGNLDAVGMLQNGSEEELRREIARQIAAGRRNGGRFIMSTGSPVTPSTPVGRVRLYCDLARDLEDVLF